MDSLGRSRLHELEELAEIDPAVLVRVVGVDHALALGVAGAGGEPERGEHAPELAGVDEAVAVAVEDAERRRGLPRVASSSSNSADASSNPTDGAAPPAPPIRPRTVSRSTAAGGATAGAAAARRREDELDEEEEEDLTRAERPMAMTLREMVSTACAMEKWNE